MRQNMIATIVASAVSAAVAGTAAWFGAKAKYEKIYRDLADYEIAKEMETLRDLYRLDRDERIRQAAPKIEVMEFTAEEVAETADLLKEDLPEDVVQALGEYRGGVVINSRIDYTKATVQTPEGTKTLEEVIDETFPEEASEDGVVKSMVITADEYLSGESGFGQYNLTYYEGDNVLADENDEPSTTARKWLGKNLKRFGDKSGDPNVVYIRVPKFESEFEVVRDFSSYASVVAGLANSEG